MGIDTLTEYIVVAVGLLVLLGGLAVGLLRGGRGTTKELPPQQRPPERPKGTTDHRSGTIVLDRPSEHAQPQAPPAEAKGEQPPADETPVAKPAAEKPVTETPDESAPAEDFTPVESDADVDRARTVPPVTPQDETAETPAPAEPEVTEPAIGEDLVKETVDGIRADVVAEIVGRFVPPESIDAQWDLPGLEAALEADFGLRLDLRRLVEEEIDAEGITAHVQEAVDGLFAAKEQQIGSETMRMLEKHLMLNVVDQSWKEHLARMDYLRQGIYLRGYAQKQPKQEYKREAFLLFSEMLDKVKREVIAMLARVRSWLHHLGAGR